jgi:hypothetical protein
MKDLLKHADQSENAKEKSPLLYEAQRETEGCEDRASGKVQKVDQIYGRELSG